MGVRKTSAVPSGLLLTGCRVPNVETLGYYRPSLRDDVLQGIGLESPRSERLVTCARPWVKCLQMEKPWSAEQALDESRARALIEAQFPELRPAGLTLIGVGWDNTAFLVNDTWVFRFPRRQIAVPTLQYEARLLPRIAARLPLPVPIPQFCGQPSQEYPWPFSGYRLLPGHTASAAALDDSQRLGAAEPIARFLRALHSLPADEMARLGAGPDTLGRLEVVRRATRTEQRLAKLIEFGLVEDPKPLVELIEGAKDLKTPSPPRGTTLVHGDLYATHLLVDEHCRPCGVIDWGDIHLGHPALDLALVFGFLPPAGRNLFFNVYGAIADETARLARFKALESAVAIVAYGRDTGKLDLLREGQAALRYVLKS